MLAHGKHRSLELAERHLRELQRENPKATVRIVERSNSTGKESAYGHFFTFDVRLPRRRRKVARGKKRAPKQKLFAFLLSFHYTPKNQRSHGGNKAKLRADFIVAGNANLRRRDSVEVFQILIQKVIEELPESTRWLAVLAQQVVGNERAEVDSTPMPNVKPPKKAQIRSAYRAGKLLYGNPSAGTE